MVLAQAFEPVTDTSLIVVRHSNDQFAVLQALTPLYVKTLL